MPQEPGDRQRPAPQGTLNYAYVSQLVDMRLGPAFTVEPSMHATQAAVVQLLNLATNVPLMTLRDDQLHTQFKGEPSR